MPDYSPLTAGEARRLVRHSFSEGGSQEGYRGNSTQQQGAAAYALRLWLPFRLLRHRHDHAFLHRDHDPASGQEGPCLPQLLMGDLLGKFSVKLHDITRKSFEIAAHYA